MSKAKIPASLGGIEFDCTISRERTYEADVPEYPVEGGFTVSDAILKKPLGLEVVVFVTNMPVTWAKIHAGSNRVKTVSDALVNLYLSGKPVSFVTPDKVYENMAITKLSLPEEDYANAIEIALSLKQVMGNERQRGLKYDSYLMKVQDDSIKGEVGMRYEIRKVA